MSDKNPTESFTASQAQSVEQALAYSRAAAESFERLTRQHYAMVGDLVDYTLAQLHVPSDASDPRAVLEAQAANARELAEKTRSRMEQYAAIASDMRGLANASGASASESAGSRPHDETSDRAAGGTPAGGSSSAKAASAAAEQKSARESQAAAKTQADEKALRESKAAAKKSADEKASREAQAAVKKPAAKTAAKPATKAAAAPRAKKKAASRKA